MYHGGEVQLPIQELFCHVVGGRREGPGRLSDNALLMELFTTMPRFKGVNPLSESTEVQMADLEKLVGDALIEGLSLLLSARQSALPASVQLLNWGELGWSDAWPSNAGVLSDSWLLGQVEATVVLTDLLGNIGVLLVPRKVVALIEKATSLASGSSLDHTGASQTPQG